VEKNKKCATDPNDYDFNSTPTAYSSQNREEGLQGSQLYEKSIHDGLVK